MDCRVRQRTRDDTNEECRMVNEEFMNGAADKIEELRLSSFYILSAYFRIRLVLPSGLLRLSSFYILTSAFARVCSPSRPTCFLFRSATDQRRLVVNNGSSSAGLPRAEAWARNDNRMK